MTTAASAPGSSVGSRRTVPLPDPVGPGVGRASRQQWSWAALGLLLVVMSMLGVSLWSNSQNARSPALVAARPLAAGETIATDDLAIVAVGADAGLNLLGVGQEEVVVGRVARGPIPAGTPLSAALVVASSDAVPEGGAVVGAVLEAGQYPTGSLRAGDRVRLVRTASAAGTEAESTALPEATVWSVEPVVEGRRELFVSLLVAEADAGPVADAAALDRLRLVLLRAGG